MKKDLIRHGDLLFVPRIITINTGQSETGRKRREVRRKGKVILEGEVTGHAHRITAGEADILDYYEKTWREGEEVLRATFVSVTEAATVTHEEHKPVTLMPGLYEVIRAREFDYASNLARRVQD